MCGISLIYSASGDIEAGKRIQQMTDALAHRGPDGKAVVEVSMGRGRLWLGHTRLEVIGDFEHGSQPMFAEDGRYIMLYNGEVYNFRELADEDGMTEAKSDTEVIFHLLLSHGQLALSRLNGMFAIVFVDTLERKIWIARDRHGIKPLFYCEKDGAIEVCSEQAPLLGPSPIISAAETEHFLRYKFPQIGNTLLQGIFELGPGQVIEISSEGITHHPIPSPPLSGPDPCAKYAEPLRQTEKLLQDALDRHLVADVPTGLFLSGGVDSTLLLALWSNRGITVPTFSISYKEESGQSEDGLHARLAAETYKADHEELLVTPALLSESFFEMMGKMDRPIGDGALCLTYMLAKMARKKVKVALSGAGADELFGGYRRHAAISAYLDHLHGRPILTSSLKGLHSLLKSAGLNQNALEQVASALAPSAGHTFLNFTAIRQLTEGNAEPLNVPEIANIQDALAYDRANYLVGDVLAVNDLAGMRHGLEVRTPYLDNELVIYVSGLDSKVLRGNSQKWMLKALLKKYGGEKFVSRKKMGFGLPFGRWMAAAKLPELQELLENYQGPLTNLLAPKAQAILKKNRKTDCSQELWTLCILMAWLQRTF